MSSLPTATVVPMGGAIPRHMQCSNMAAMDPMGHDNRSPSMMVPLGSSPLPVEAAARSSSGRSHPRNALERREWTTEEDDLIRHGVKTFGYRWRRIASELQVQKHARPVPVPFFPSPGCRHHSLTQGENTRRGTEARTV
jgi:hypothetical protein